MPKTFITTISVPSGSRPEQFTRWLNTLLQSHRMEALATFEPLIDITSARAKVAAVAMQNNEATFAGEVIAGSWDHRHDVQAALIGRPLITVKDNP